MQDLVGAHVVVLDVETAQSAEDCRHCGQSESIHMGNFPEHCSHFHAIGWDDKAALGLSVGCYWDYTDQRVHWFDTASLEVTMRHLVDRQPLLVSFNGIAFDFPLMDAVCWKQQGILAPPGVRTPALELSMAWSAVTGHSYDILDQIQIWQADPARKYERGLNSLDAIAQANGLGAKLGHGAQAPRDWREGRYADVLNYCAMDVELTRRLFEMICEGKPLLRRDGLPLSLPIPDYRERLENVRKTRTTD